MYAVLISVFSPSFSVRIFSEIMMLFVMTIIAFGRKQIKTYIKILLSMLVFSLLFGGMITMIIMNGNFSVNILFVVACVSLFGVFSIKSIRILQLNTKVKKVRVQIENMGKTCVLVLLCDSGNLLVDPYNSAPVILIDKKHKNELMTCEDGIIKNSIRLVPVKTICGNSLVEVFTPESVTVLSRTNRRVDASVGFVSAECLITDECNGIFPGVLTNNL